MSAAIILAASFGLGLFAWLAPASIEISGWPKSGIERLALFAPLYALWAVLAASAALAALLWWGGGARRLGDRAHVVAPLCALWLCTVPYLPWLPDRFPLLLILAGPVRWLLAAGVAITMGVRLARVTHIGRGLREASEGWLTHRGAGTVFLLSFVLFTAIGFRSLRIVGLGGDEPHYLVITQSLLVDHDLKIENNHAQGDYRAFFPGELKPDYLQRGTNGEIYSIHAPGLAALMLPGYAFAGSRGAVATVAFFAAIAAAGIFEAALALGGALVGWATWASVCLSVPFVPHAWALYPEILGAAIAALVVVWILRRGSATAMSWLGRGAVVGALPWLHTKFAVLLAALTLWVLIELRGRIKESLAFLVPIAISGFAWLAYFYVIYGTIDPQAPYGEHTTQFVRMENLPRSLLGLLLDPKFGLFVYSPIYLVAAAGAVILLRDRARRALALFLCGTTALYALSSAREYMWWGGSSAPARYLVPVMPLVAPMIAVAFARLRRAGQTALVGVLAAAGVVISAWSIVSFDRLILFSNPHGAARLFEELQGSAPLTAAFPTFVSDDWTMPLLRMLPWVLAAALGAVAVLVAGKRLSRFWALLAGAATFIVLAAGLTAQIPAEAKLEAATRGRVALMEAYDPQRLRAFDYQRRAKMTPAEWIAAGGVTVQLDPTQPVDGYGRLAGPLALAPGTYTATVWFQGTRERDGDLLLALGGGQTLRRVEGPLPNPTTVTFEMPVAIPSLWVQLTDVATAQQAIRVEITPAALVPASERLPVTAHAVEMVPGRPNAYMEYLDEWTFPEGGVFWTRGTGKGAVVVAPAGAREIVLTLHVGPNAGIVHLSAGSNTQDITMRAEETREVPIPVPPGAQYLVIAAQAASDFRPAEVNPSSADMRRLGAQIRVDVR